MKLFKITIDRPKRDGREVLVHAEEEEEALARIASKYKGWTVSNVVEIVGEAHFTIALLEPE